MKKTSTSVNQQNQTSDDIPISFRRITATLLVFCLSFPFSLFSPSEVLAIEEKPDHLEVIEFATSFAYQGEFLTDASNLKPITHIPEYWDDTFTAVMQQFVDEHGINDHKWPQRIDAFMSMTRHIESDNKRDAYNASGAMSYYQFKGPSILTAYNRLHNYMKRHDMGRTPYWTRLLAENPHTIYSYSKEQQAVFVLANIIEQDKKTGLLPAFLSGDLQSAKEIYYKYHHTRPDSHTINRTQKLFKTYFGNI